MEDFQVVHRYRTLARRGAVEPLACENCSSEYITRVGADDEVVLECFRCETRTAIGQRLIMMMEQAIKNYEENRT